MKAKVNIQVGKAPSLHLAYKIRKWCPKEWTAASENYWCNWAIHVFSYPLCRFGPLVRHWMMRFEARDRYFKRLAVQLGNIINVAYSLAMRHQRLKCYHSLEKTTIEGEEVEIGPCKPVKPESVVGFVMDVRGHRDLQVRVLLVLFVCC